MGTKGAAAKPKRKAKESKSIIPYDVAQRYTVHNVKTASGKRRCVDNDDAVARMTRGKDEKELARIARANGLSDRWKNWQGLNPGQRKMALNNSLRHLDHKPHAAA